MSQANVTKLMKLATLCSVAVAISIISIKLFAWVYTDSLSLLSSLVDSVMDLVASMVTFFAVRYSLQPADEDHRFGHGKAEDIAAFAQSAFIAGSGIFIVMEAVSRFITPHEVLNEMAGIWVMVASSVLTVFLLSFQKYVISQTKSTAIQADSLHYKTDLLINALVITSYICAMLWGLELVDPILASIIALYIFKTAWHIGKQAFDKLMDKEFSDDERTQIIDAILEHKGVKGVHDLRTRFSGLKQFIQFHLELDGSIELSKAHEISDEVEARVLKIFPDAEVLVHQDVAGNENIAPQKGRVVPAEKR